MMLIQEKKMLTFKNNSPCIIDDAEDLYIVMSKYNFLEYSNNYSMTSEILWNYYKDEVYDDAN